MHSNDTNPIWGVSPVVEDPTFSGRNLRPVSCHRASKLRPHCPRYRKLTERKPRSYCHTHVRSVRFPSLVCEKEAVFPQHILGIDEMQREDCSQQKATNR